MSSSARGVRDFVFVCVVVAALLAWYNGGFHLPAAAGPSAPLVAPVPGGRVTSGFGTRPASGVVSAAHWGTDIAAPKGTPIRAIADGTIIVARPASGFGLWMQLRHTGGTVSVYGHMDRMLKKAGDRVRAGDQIATVGQRGEATGPHLHLEIWPGGERDRHTDPVAWFRARHVSITAGTAR